MISIGLDIRRRRTQLKLSQRALAADLGMDKTSLARIESGQRFPKSFVGAVAKFLQVAPEEVQERIAADRLAANVGDLYLSQQYIETTAERDRGLVFNYLGRNHFVFPKDRDKIPRILCGLDVFYERDVFSTDVVTAAQGKQIYAGLFPDGHSYHGTTRLIVVASDPVKRSRQNLSEQTKTFHVLHEVGHYQLHWLNKPAAVRPGKSQNPLFCSSGDNSIAEVQANLYAISFLLPRHELSARLDDDLRFNIRKNFKNVCEEFFVEGEWLTWRLNRLGIATY